MTDSPKISDAEWAIMKQLWHHHPQSANQIAEYLCKQNNWKDKTVKTLISRLLAKQVIGFTKKGRQYMYFPLIEHSKCAQAESRSFLRRVFDGTVKPMLATLLENEKLSDKEIEELKAILENKSRQNNGNT